MTRKKRVAPDPPISANVNDLTFFGSIRNSWNGFNKFSESPIENNHDRAPTPPPKNRGGTMKSTRNKRPPPPPPPIQTQLGLQCESPCSEIEEASSSCMSPSRFSSSGSNPQSGHTSPSVDDSGVNSDSDRPRSSASSQDSSQLRPRLFSRTSQDSLSEEVEDEAAASINRTLRHLTTLRDEMIAPPPPPEFSDFGSEPLSLLSNTSASSLRSSGSSQLDLIQAARGTLKKRHDDEQFLEKSLRDRLQQSLAISEYEEDYSNITSHFGHVEQVGEANGHETFAGVRFAPELVDPEEGGFKDVTIRSQRGTIRGVKNRVRRGIATFLRDPNKKNFTELETGKVVVYITTLGVLRDTYARCVKVRQILRTHLIKVEERDVFMSRENQLELMERTEQPYLEVPKVFVEGRYLGDAEVIENLNEQGELKHILKPFKCYSVTVECQKCGGFRMLPCQVCSGSKKSLHRNNFTESFVALRCSHCDDSALVKCDLCAR
ncbi:hypothetical protein TCAL_01916 [Tigriopus californicus]|uniref:Glutaredoxin domain-containing protein n=1 Tax=Tigriopus californicus TaxID=6832 RepID=A0A553P6M0_TIGCA|nr:glutaredoxin domain-containing cysteine-rich protein CG31559-like [Tigriopus californicus]TRY73322.1 hypothetical protein TCAL_01916 [Tigriopus californicus]